MRIYIDSRYRTPDSASASDFTLELNETFQLPMDSRVRLHDIAVPYSWRTVEENLNQEIWLEERPGAQSVKRVLKLTPGQYDGRSLATALQTLLNTDSAWSLLANGGLEAPYTVTYSEQTGSVRISLANAVVGSSVLWSDAALKALPSATPTWVGGSTSQPRSFNRNLRVATNVTIGAGTTPFVSQFVDLITIKDLYVHSSSLGNLSNVGPRPGDRSCLCKVAVTSGYGYLIHSDGASWEFAGCTAGQLVKRLSFTLQDATGAVVPLHGCDWSFALTFSDPLDEGGRTG